MQIAVSLPEMPRPRREELISAERVYGQRLIAAGTIARIWRIPGGLANVGIWVAADATELHRAIADLPLFQWIRADVTPLALHPLEAGEDQGQQRTEER